MISVSVVTYNNAHCLPQFLDCLRQQTGVPWDLWVFDNASQDQTPALLHDAGLGRVHLSDVNIGCGRGHNHNAARCCGTHLLFLNPDLEFGPHLFADLWRYLQEHPDHVLAGPRVLEGPDRTPFPPRRFYPGEGMVALEPGLHRSHIAWLNGCCFIIRRDVFEQLGGFDPDFFLYQDETDLCLRARRAGYRIGHADTTAVYHLQRQSQRELSEYEYARRIVQGSTTFWTKHYPPREVVRMVRFQYWTTRALLGLDLVRRWLPDLPSALSATRLRARNDVCLEWLHTHGRHSVGLEGVPGKIAWRQCRLIAEWALRRRAPLDDY